MLGASVFHVIILFFFFSFCFFYQFLLRYFLFFFLQTWFFFFFFDLEPKQELLVTDVIITMWLVKNMYCIIYVMCTEQKFGTAHHILLTVGDKMFFQTQACIQIISFFNVNEAKK